MKESERKSQMCWESWRIGERCRMRRRQTCTYIFEKKVERWREKKKKKLKEKREGENYKKN